MAEIRLEGISKVYPDGTRAVDGLDLSVADGELLVLVGPSGCGKSTVLRLLAGLDTPSAGHVRIGGRVVDDLPAQRRNVAMVFQDYALYPHLSVRGNIEFPLRMRGVPRDAMRTRVQQVAGLLGIVEQLDRLPRQLSGGQRQRVAMGRALVRDCDTLLLDEPLSNLDARLRVQMREEIAALHREGGLTMLYVTHDQVEAMTLGDRVAVLDHGRLMQVASAACIYERPANLFVAAFLGSPPMNLFTATLSRKDDTTWLQLGEQRVALEDSQLEGADLNGRLDRLLTVGVRPESLVPADDGIAGTVRHVEQLGHETLVHVAVPGARVGADPVVLVARVPGNRARPLGGLLRLRVGGGRVHLFDEDGRAAREPQR